MGHIPNDLTGFRMKHAVALERCGRTAANKVIWRCRCDCGNEFEAISSRIKNGSRVGCGCKLSRPGNKSARTHGMTGSPEFKSWEGAKRRCLNLRDKDYKRYGARGIQFSDKWSKFESFYRDMGPKPGPEYSLDRIDTNGNYEPGNCRWATHETQQNNRRNNIRIQVNGVHVSLYVYFGRDRSAAWQRAAYRIRNGWSIADAIFQPANHRNR